MIDTTRVKVPLYHGTSTLFLEDIMTFGLGGKNPIADLGLINLVTDILPLIDRHLSDTKIFQSRARSFAIMAEQRSHSRGMNFQHGQTYLSPSRDTAVRYATNKRYGSELLTYTLDFLQALIDRDVPGVCDDLYRKYSGLFNLLDVSAAPILFRVDDVSIDALCDEYGNDPGANLSRIAEATSNHPEVFELLLQQTNFRLLKPVLPEKLNAWLVHVRNWNGGIPDYSLFEVRLCQA